MNDKQETNKQYGKEVEKAKKYTVDNMGYRQRSMLNTIAKHQKRGDEVPSKRYLIAYEDVGNPSGYETIEKLLNRGLVRLNEESGTPQGEGSLELTDSGLVYLMVYDDELRDYGLRQVSNRQVEASSVEYWLVDDIGESVHSTLLMLLK